MRQRCYILVALSILALAVQGQRSVVSSGGDAVGTSGTMAWSVGQCTYTASENSVGSVSQGVQQAHVPIILDDSDFLLNGPDITFSPNPAIDNIILRSGLISDVIHYHILDAKGELLFSGAASQLVTFIPLGHLPSGLYLISLFDEGLPIHSARIIKL